MSEKPPEPPEDPTWHYGQVKGGYEWLAHVTPINVLKWASVLAVIALYVLLVISIVIALWQAS